MVDRGQRGSSIRARMRLWIVIVSTVTLLAFTTAGILEERRQVLATEAVHAAALLEHLAHMPEFQADAATAAAHVALLHGSLAAVGGRLELGAADGEERTSSSWTSLARRRLELRDAHLELRYRADPARLGGLTRRAVLIHSAHGAVALTALLLATEWILRRNLLAPLRALTRQIGLIRDGRGWTPKLPQTDEELRELTEALHGLGPGLERQVHEWIEAERRSAVAMALRRTGDRLQGTRSRLLDLLAELEGAWVVPSADRERRIRSLVQEVDRIPAVIDSEARHAFALMDPRAATEQPRRGLRGERE